MTSAFQFSKSDDGIAELCFDLPGEKVNKFSNEVILDLEKHIDTIAGDNSIKVLKLTSAKEGVFIAGADLHSFEPAFKDPKLAKVLIHEGHRVFNKLQKLPYPTVAVINGACLGGGLECALSCTYRLVTDNPKTILALPEVTLGIFPGWGGTQRLPRLVGLAEGVNMILTGRNVNGLKAYKLKLADAIVPTEFLQDKTNEFIQMILKPEGRAKILERRKKKSWFDWILESTPPGRGILFRQAENSVLEKTKGRYPAPLIALKVIKETCTLPLDEGLRKEAEIFISNIPQGFILAENLITLFFTQEAAKKETGAPPGIKGKQVKTAAVLGAGTMGASLAWILADHGILTHLKDISWELVGKGVGVARALFAKGLKNKKINKYDLDRRFHLIRGTIDYSGFQQVDLVIEAATENLELKRKIFQELEECVRPDTIIATNTSSLTLKEMSTGFKHPERFVAMHFFNPVNKMPLIEIVGGDKGSPESVATAVELSKKLGKTPLVVGDCPGFLVNRIFVNGANEVMLQFEEGYSKEQLIKTALDFGMPMDPFELADEVGVDVSYKVSKTLEEAYGERMHPAKISQIMVEKGFLGRKTGKGFYIYEKGSKEFNPAVKDIIKSIGRVTSDHPEDELLPRFIYIMVNEASRCLEEGIIKRADFLDLSLIMGIGFPPFRGGLLKYADNMGIANVVNTMHKLEAKHGMRFKPTALLENMAKENKTFY